MVADREMNRFSSLLLLAVALVACSNSGGSGGKKPTTCSGSGLANDPTGHNCTAPPPPTQGCTSPLLANVGNFSLQASMPAQQSSEEASVAVDPRQGQNTVFVGVIQSDLVPSASGDPTASCVSAKHISVYRTDNNGKLTLMTGLPPAPAHEWQTDPGLAVGPDGTLYFTFLRWTAPCGNSTDPNCLLCNQADDAISDVEIWFAPPGSTALQPGLPDDQTLINVLPSTNTGFPRQPNQLPAIVGTESHRDHPKLAVNPVTPGQIAIYVNGGNTFDDQVFTFTQSSSTAKLTPQQPITFPDQASNGLDQKGSLFINPAFDASGALYLAMGLLVDTNAQGHVVVRKYTNQNGAWTQVGGDGSPTVPQGQTYAFTSTQVQDFIIPVPSSPASGFMPDFTPAIAVGALNGSSDPVVYLAFEVLDAQKVRRMVVTAANGTDVTRWTTPVLLDVPAGGLFSLAPTLSLDTANDVLDLVDFAVMGSSPQGNPLNQMALGTFFYRFDASQLTQLIGPFKVNMATPSLADLPSRPESFSGVIYPGEYLGLATKGLSAYVGWPEIPTSGPADVELGFGQITESCGGAVALADPDSLWECSCQCGQNEFSFTPMVGCAPGSATTAAQACPQVCTGASTCGGALSCANMTCNGGFGNARLISTQSCAVLDGAATGAPPASSADFTVADTGASTATMTIAGQTATTPVAGQAFVSASTSPPTAGAIAEIARLAVQPADVFVGGSVNAFVRNIAVAHRSRLRGTFTDATHFQLPAGAVELIVTVQTQPASGPLSAPVNLRAANTAPMTGVLDLTQGTFSLDGSAVDGLGNSLALHFTANVTNRPADANHNGIIDAVDKCPGEAVGPDRSPPVFTSVPPSLTITSCSNVNIGQAVATDPCGVTVKNNAPAKFPLGITTVVWTATDGAGNVATAIQTVTVELGNDPSCCPAGTHVIMGTSNNDVIVGTSGPDCILGLGGQDTISGGDGDDVISGGDGDDVIYGQGGNDRIYGGSGQDKISGGPGNDFISGGDGVDQINGDDGNDVIVGGQGGDVIHGGAGNDVINGDADDDQLYGDDGNDTLFGGEGNDSLFGGNDNDVLHGGDGDDKLDGGPGVNSFDGGPGHNVCIDNNVTLLMCPASVDQD